MYPRFGEGWELHPLYEHLVKWKYEVGFVVLWNFKCLYKHVYEKQLTINVECDSYWFIDCLLQINLFFLCVVILDLEITPWTTDVDVKLSQERVLETVCTTREEWRGWAVLSDKQWIRMWRPGSVAIRGSHKPVEAQTLWWDSLLPSCLLLAQVSPPPGGWPTLFSKFTCLSSMSVSFP